jgi:hypothetical protein
MMICPISFIAEYTMPPRSAYYLCALATPAKRIAALSTAPMLCPARPSSAYSHDSLV